MNTSPSQPSLLFIPDISGFTEFVNQTEIHHSQHIIEELLEAIIEANEIGLVVSEIEGDAVLFYRDGQAPTAAELLAQVQRMYVRFHAHLRRYDTHRICQCGACSSASGLALKFIVHYGDVSKNQIKDHSKLFGRDVIVAHRLMKNDVPYDEYVLLTHDLLKACETWVEIEQVAWAHPTEGKEIYDAGAVQYCYIPLEALQAHVPAPTVEDYGDASHTWLQISNEAVIEAPLDLVFDVVSDLSARPLWMAGLKRADAISTKLPQASASHRCVFYEDESKDPLMVTHGFKISDDAVTFTDTEAKQGFSTVFVLQQVGPALTRVKKHLLIKNSILFRIYFRLFHHKNFAAIGEASFVNLNVYCKGLISEGRWHPSRVVLFPGRSNQVHGVSH